LEHRIVLAQEGDMKSHRRYMELLMMKFSFLSMKFSFFVVEIFEIFFLEHHIVLAQEGDMMSHQQYMVSNGWYMIAG
jgi:hypothetical protein